MDKQSRTELITAVEKVLTMAIPCAAISFCVWVVTIHAHEFAGKTSVVQIQMAFTLGLGLATGTGGVGYGLHQRNLRKQLNKEHEKQMNMVTSLMHKKARGAGR
jgi:hypothetical protein